MARWWALAVAVLVLAGLGRSVVAQVPVSFPTSHLDIASASGAVHGFTVELATSHEQLAQGLMYRRSLAPEAGMLFDFGQIETAHMWMKNTLIPLDMVFIAADGLVVGVAERTVPQSLAVISSPAPILAVLELNGGTAERLGIRAGDRVRHPLFPEHARGN